MARAQSSTVSSGDMESTLCGPGLILQTEHFTLLILPSVPFTTALIQLQFICVRP